MSETREMYETFRDVWAFLKEYYNCHAERRADQMNAAQQELYKKHKSKLCGDLIQVSLNEIDRRSR